MAKLLLVALAAVAVTCWVGGGGPVVQAQDIIFREPSVPSMSPRPMPLPVTKVKPSCAPDDKGVCEEDPEYDARVQEHINRLLRQDTQINALVRDPSLNSILNDVGPEISIRTLPTESETPVCHSQETLIYPKRAKTSNDDWVFVLNQEGVQQALRVEKCIKDGSPCSISSVLPSDAKATCRQKYVYRRMLTLGTNKIQPEEVLMPACCVCYTTYSDLIPDTRISNNTRSQTPAHPAASPMPAGPNPANPHMAMFTSPNRAPVNFHFARSLRRRNSRYPGGRK